jgi:hypothetical protein
VERTVSKLGAQAEVILFSALQRQGVMAAQGVLDRWLEVGIAA